MKVKIEELFKRNEAAIKDLAEITDTISSIRQVLKVSAKILEEIHQQISKEENNNEIIK